MKVYVFNSKFTKHLIEGEFAFRTLAVLQLRNRKLVLCFYRDEMSGSLGEQENAVGTQANC